MHLLLQMQFNTIYLSVFLTLLPSTYKPLQRPCAKKMLKHERIGQTAKAKTRWREKTS